MQPMRSDERERLKQAGITDEEINEYEQLCAERSARPNGWNDSLEGRAKAARLHELAKKIMNV